MAADKAVLLLSCLDQPGIIARVSSHLYRNGCNIITSDQHTDDQDGHFFWRIFLDSRKLSVAQLRDDLAGSLPGLLPGLVVKWELHDSARRDRVVLMVSKLPHCMMDLLSRHHVGELDGEIVGVISNHPDLAPLAEPFKIPFTVIPVVRDNKSAAEAALLRRLGEMRADTVVLARYMQVLSGDFLGQWGKLIVNIHHSFLPAFAGARPYKQAHDRGVKLIGATAHYVTEELDAGPIIAQATTEVTHRDPVAELARKGKDLEVTVLAKAVRAHLQKRVLLHGNRTIVFD